MSVNTNKKRSPNFSQREKTLLLHCAFEERDKIENKKTDAVTWKEKECAWKRIENKFNSQSGACFRSNESLKRFFINYKAEIRKEAAKEKKSSVQTGGGKPYVPTDPNFDLAVTIMNPKTVYGLENEFDGEGTVERDIENCEEEEKSDDFDWNKYKPSMLKNKVHPKLKISTTNKDDSISADENMHGDENETGIMKKGFQKQFESPNPVDNAPWSSRRRPVASSLQSSKITEQYSELSKIKIELAKLQYDTFKEEAIEKKTERELKRKSFELDVAIKSEVLKKIQKENCTAKDAHNVLKDIELFFKDMN